MQKKKTKTIILRFRDLGIEVGQTIERHKRIIEKKKAVWWSWWRKGNEKVPETVLSTFKTRAENTSIEIYLLDSWQKKAYKAVCIDIKFRVENEKTVNIPSPDKDLTPEYYRNAEHPAWFKFISIVECPYEELQNYSYVIEKDLFTDPDTDYSMFDGKRIYSIQELIQQNVSMWFGRAHDDEDPAHEIILQNPSIMEPFDFSPNYHELKSNELLWLSDLHCGGESAVPVIQSDKEGETPLSKHIEKLEDIGGLLISGDITDCGMEKGFDIAEKLLGELNGNVRHPLSSETILFCPGNHDFMRIEEDLLKSRAERIKKDEMTTRFYADFYRIIHHKAPNEYFACGRKYLMACGRTVEIAALNSVMLQQYQNFEGHGYLSQEQLDYVAENMGWKYKKESAAIRIAVMHHHYLPTCYVEDVAPQKPGSVVYDANRLMAWMNDYNVRILLHGHKHVPFAAMVEMPSILEQNCNFGNGKYVYIIGMGSTCVPSSSGNVYAKICFLRDSVNINFYKLSGDNSEQDRLERTITIPI